MISKFKNKLSLKNFKKYLKNNLLLILTIISVAVGIGLGILIRNVAQLNQTEKDYFAFPGEIFLRALKFLIFPLIASSLLSSINDIQRSKTGSIAIKALIFYLITTITAILLSILLCVTIQPGSRSKKNSTNSSILSNKTTNVDQKYIIVNTIFDLIRNLFPDNMIEIGFQLYESKTEAKYKDNLTFDYWHVNPGSRGGLNIVGLAFYTVIFGITVSRMGEKGKILLDLANIINDACIKIIKWIMWYSPIGNCFLICNVIININDLNELFQSIPFYILTMFVSLIAQGLLVALIFLILTRSNIIRYAKNLLEALIMAFATSSSAASLPITLKCVEEKNKVPKLISRFMLTAGTSINVDGTTMYTLIAALFIAQFNSIELTPVDYFVASITAAFASIGSAGIPAGATLALLTSLNALNIPIREISIFLSLDWLMDRFYTVHNVWGASCGTGVVSHLQKSSLKKKAKKTQNLSAISDRSSNEIDQISISISEQALKLSGSTEPDFSQL